MWDGFVERYEPYMEAALDRFLKPGGVFFDVGAHAGVWTEYAARRVGPTEVVVACEPSPAYRLLDAHVGCLAGVRLRNVAVGAKPGETQFHAHGDSSSGSVLAAVTEINRRYRPDIPVTPITISMTTLDRLAEAEGVMPTVIKVDVEGYELEVLLGAKELLRSAAAWVVEIHPPQLRLHGRADGEVTELLTTAGYPGIGSK